MIGSNITGTRGIIYRSILSIPGIHFRDLIRQTELSCGQMTYHLHFLRKSNKIEAFRHHRNLRLFDIGFSEEDKTIISNLRNPSSRNLLMEMTRKKITHSDASQVLGFSPSTTTWYLKKLQQDMIIRKERNIFYLINPENVGNILNRYRESFMDRLAVKFIKTWEL